MLGVEGAIFIAVPRMFHLKVIRETGYLAL